MTEEHWNWHQHQHQQHPQQQLPHPVMIDHTGSVKRRRTEYDLRPAMPSGHEMHTYPPHDDDPGVSGLVKDTKSIESSYDQYLESVKRCSLISGEASSFSRIGPEPTSHVPMFPINAPPGFGGPDSVRNELSTRDMPMEWTTILPKRSSLISGEASWFSRIGPGPTSHDPMSPIDAPPGFGGPDSVRNEPAPRDIPGGRPTHEGLLPIPPNATNTLFVVGFPNDCRKREVAHIFRPFVGYRGVRLVTSRAKYVGDICSWANLSLWFILSRATIWFFSALMNR